MLRLNLKWSRVFKIVFLPTGSDDQNVFLRKQLMLLHTERSCESMTQKGGKWMDNPLWLHKMNGLYLSNIYWKKTMGDTFSRLRWWSLSKNSL